VNHEEMLTERLRDTAESETHNKVIQGYYITTVRITSYDHELRFSLKISHTRH